MISLFNLFSIGIGPSSSHTVGPMLAAQQFVLTLVQKNLLTSTTRLQTDLYGSLALTGVGHGTDIAILNGLEGQHPETVDPTTMLPRMQAINIHGMINLANQHAVPFSAQEDLLWHQREFLPKHSNAMRFTAYNQHAKELLSQTYYSIGGGFIVRDEDFSDDSKMTQASVPFSFNSADELLQMCDTHGCSIADIVRANEKTWRSEEQIEQGILAIANTMDQCIERGIEGVGELPGLLKLKRRAPELHKKLQSHVGIHSIHEDADIMNRLNLYAMAVNEENAAGGRIVTAPTNGAAGVIPAVMRYYMKYHQSANPAGLINFFLTAGAIGILYKKNASISGAEVGCQGEVGVASSMAAAALAAVLGGTPQHVENAAEIAMEHHLGLPCDPIGGLVQIPCIERNAMGAVKAVNAARMALLGEGYHVVSLDKVISTMRTIGRDMMTIYKETSLGGLAVTVNVTEC